MKNEIKRLMFGPKNQQVRGLGLCDYRVKSKKNVAELLERARNMLVMLISVEQLIETGLYQGAVEEWLQEEVDEAMTAMLQHWFADELTDELADNSDQDIAFPHLRAFHDGRDWRWWNVQPVNDGEALIQLEIHGAPVSGLDSLRWLLLTLGADTFEEVAAA